MLNQADSSGSPDWWLLRLGKRLETERPRLERLDNYWRGNHPIPFGNRKMREAYRRFQRMSRTNFMLLVAEAVLERLRVVGFRAGGEETVEADKKAWSWWQANDLDSVSGLVHRAAIVMSRSYVCVGEDPDKPGQPLVTGEDPRQVIHEESPTNRRTSLAALKHFWDDVVGKHQAVLYLPDEVHYFTAKSKDKDVTATELWSQVQWTASEAPESNPFGEVPVVPFRCRPDLCGDTLGEFEDVTPIQDRINTQVLDRMVISAMQAYRQRYATGVSATDAEGNPSLGFDPGADLLWAVEDEHAKFGDFTAADLGGILKSVESDVAHTGAITRTPAHYLMGSIVNASGEALAAAETGLVSKARERLTEFSASWERVNTLAGKVIGETVADDAEVIWADPQFRTLTEQAAASVQLVAAGVPWRTRMTLLDFSPQEIARMIVERTQDQMLEASLQPPAPQGVAGQNGRTPPQGNGNGGQVSMRNGPGSGQGGTAAPQTAAARAQR